MDIERTLGRIFFVEVNCMPDNYDRRRRRRRRRMCNFNCERIRSRDRRRRCRLAERECRRRLYWY